MADGSLWCVEIRSEAHMVGKVGSNYPMLTDKGIILCRRFDSCSDHDKSNIERTRTKCSGKDCGEKLAKANTPEKRPHPQFFFSPLLTI